METFFISTNTGILSGSFVSNEDNLKTVVMLLYGAFVGQVCKLIYLIIC